MFTVRLRRKWAESRDRDQDKLEKSTMVVRRGSRLREESGVRVLRAISSRKSTKVDCYGSKLSCR